MMDKGRLFGIPIIASELIPPGQFMMIDGQLFGRARDFDLSISASDDRTTEEKMRDRITGTPQNPFMRDTLNYKIQSAGVDVCLADLEKLRERLSTNTPTCPPAASEQSAPCDDTAREESP